MDHSECKPQEEDEEGGSNLSLTALRVHASILEASEILIPEDIFLAVDTSSLTTNSVGGPRLDQIRDRVLVFKQQQRQQLQESKQQVCDDETPEYHQQRLSIRVEEGAAEVHLDTKDTTTTTTTTTTSTSERDSFKYAGSTQSSQRIALVLQEPPANKHQVLKDLGIKAKARLDEERRKRPEIVRLDNLLLPPPPPGTGKRKRASLVQTTQNNVPVGFPSSSTAKAKKNRVVKHSGQKQTPKSASASLLSSSRGIDTWTEDVSPILEWYSKHRPSSSSNSHPTGGRSTVVRVHGIPVGCTAEQIRRYFSGLDPERVFLVPTNDVYIDNLDGIAPARRQPGRRRMGASPQEDPLPQVERYPNTFRVFVKFASSPTAALARERSGEAIMLQDHQQQNQEDDPIGKHGASNSFSTVKGATIAVTQLSKSMASILFNAMAIDAVPGVALGTTLSNVEAKLHPVVGKMLWVSAAHLAWDKRHGPFQKEMRRRTGLLAPTDRWDPLTLKGYQDLAQHYNKLVQLQEDLLYQLPFPSTTTMKTTMTIVTPGGVVLPPTSATPTEVERRDPVLRLTSKACQLLGEEMDRIERILYQARVTKQQTLSRSTMATTTTMGTGVTEGDEEPKNSESFLF